ncbi:hypothetical protein MCBRY_002977 [Methylocystis bryophila]
MRSQRWRELHGKPLAQLRLTVQNDDLSGFDVGARRYPALSARSAAISAACWAAPSTSPV